MRLKEANCTRLLKTTTLFPRKRSIKTRKRRKIRLSGEYGTALYAVSGVVTLAAAALVVGSPSSISLCVLLKSLSVPVILYLFHSFRKEGTIYFYINLGISRNEFFLMPIVVEFVAFVLIMIITWNIGYAIR